MTSNSGYELSEPRRSWISKDNETDMKVYVSIKGCIPLADLIAYLGEQDADNVMVNFATVTWIASATPEDVEDLHRRQREHDARHEDWELRTYQRLHEKYGPATRTGEQCR